MQVAYVASAGDRTIHVLDLAETGKVAPIEDVIVPGPDQVEPISLPLALSGDRRFLYAAIRTPPYPVSTFAVDPANGRLRLLGSADLPAEMAYIAVDHSNTVLLGASYVQSKLAVVRVEANGLVRPKATQVFDAPRAHCIIPSIDNRSAYVALHGGDMVLHLALDLAARRLTPLNPPGFPTKAQAGPRHLALHAPSLRLFVLNERSGAVDALSIEPTKGALTPLASASMLPVDYRATPSAADIHVTSDGRFLYASERTESFITIFAVDAATGGLTPIDWVKTEASPRGFAIDPHDRFVVVAGQFSGRISVYAVDPANGGLRKTDERATGTNPNWVEIVDVGGR